MTVTSIFIIYLPILVNGIWPPSYKINFKRDEVFVVSDTESDDSDEMIKVDEVKQFNLQNDDRKYSRLHKLSLNYNKAYTGYNSNFVQKPKEFIADLEEPRPWKAGFTNLRKTLRANATSFSKYKNDKYVVRKIPSSDDNNYNYDELKEEYQMNIKKDVKSTNALNYSEPKEEENIKDAVDVLIHTPKTNCTVEAEKGVGTSALKCLFSDLVRPDTTPLQRSKIFKRIKTIIVMWISLYAIIAIPCWCQRGWCCCCFRCKFCRPHKDIDRAKKYLADNPLGTYHTHNNVVVKYKPSTYEKYAYHNLEKALSKL